jgi:imidazolonepropionase-like amidohydrolase
VKVRGSIPFLVYILPETFRPEPAFEYNRGHILQKNRQTKRESMKPFWMLLRAVLLIPVLVLAAGCTPVGQPTPAASPTPANPIAIPSATPNPVTLALVNGTLIDGTGAAPIPDGVVLITGDRISAVGPRAQIKIPEGVETTDVGGATILPGFINAHVHFGFDKTNLKAWAEGGVTTVRDESADPDQIASLKAFRAEISQDAHYARLVSAGSMIGAPGGYGRLFVASVEEVRQAVLTEREAGVEMVKTSLENGFAGASGLPKLTAEELAALVSTAHEHGLPVSGHITQGAYLQPLLDAGVDDIAHMPYDSVPTAALQQMVDKDITLTPTFTVFRNYGAPVYICVDNLRQFVKLGGRVALGNDYGGGPGDFELGIPMYEIEQMSAAGMTAMQVIVASTKNAAHVSTLEKDLGTLEAGKIADVLVVGGDPLQDLQALRQVRVVVHNGVVIRNEIAQ